MKRTFTFKVSVLFGLAGGAFLGAVGLDVVDHPFFFMAALLAWMLVMAHFFGKER